MRRLACLRGEERRGGEGTKRPFEQGEDLYINIEASLFNRTFVWEGREVEEDGTERTLRPNVGCQGAQRDASDAGGWLSHLQAFRPLPN